MADMSSPRPYSLSQCCVLPKKYFFSSHSVREMQNERNNKQSDILLLKICKISTLGVKEGKNSQHDGEAQMR